jgi:5-oxoprolinase (ATP-hydrolysing)
MKHIRIHARESLKQAIRQLPGTRYAAVEYLDDGSPLHVRISKRKTGITIDFAGTAPQHSGNLNATPAIVQSVVLYVMRLLVNRPIPMNEGLMDLIDLRIPRSLLNPDFNTRPLPAVVGGNTEVSQRLTDLLLKALDLAACSQGTMNNFLFGNARLGYYETICGGCGAGPGFTGASAVHQHMTNTRITDAEILEHRYPVEVLEFSVRKGSGGRGRWRGGDGIVRTVRFREQMDVNVLTQHRSEEPFGKHGGKPGARGRQQIVRNDGQVQKLNGLDSAQVSPGDRIEIYTPGGGGWGRVSKRYCLSHPFMNSRSS